jgi:hypothetical protein
MKDKGESCDVSGSEIEGNRRKRKQDARGNICMFPEAPLKRMESLGSTLCDKAVATVGSHGKKKMKKDERNRRLFVPERLCGLDTNGANASLSIRRMTTDYRSRRLPNLFLYPSAGTRLVLFQRVDATASSRHG